ncbi:MAG: DNA-protecting protein DprA [Bacteroidetes bacterium]|nr:DNA-protecting protein DprA [Bacteroidota bacterium]MBT6687892.1 DNA-protecting protein DprA [Bacteroidota bacterium]MBT7142460.1 DNA-protecting protein DprA [Bacteroidota bacterium]MBT7490033.1 DNA-protecting protein DprA [Bacteroidota bacterium]
MDLNLLKYKIGISLIPGIGSVIAKKLIAYIGGVEAVFKEKESVLQKIPGVGSILARSIVRQNVLIQAEKETKFIEKEGINAFFYLDADYPNRLKQCNDAPIILYSKGNVDFNQEKVISIVGTRKASSRGKEVCSQLVTKLRENNHNPIIVSGFAYGIDISAHKAAINNKLPTVAVLAHGLNTIYPALHKKYLNDIFENGAIITEFLHEQLPERVNFVKRNRIIAGISDATIVVESPVKGGSLITAEIANSYFRDVFAFPGRTNDTYSKGCNKLIKCNKAALIEDVEDLEYILNWNKKKGNSHAIQQKLFNELSENETIILDLLKENGELEIDTISRMSKLQISKVSSLLLNLEFAGLIKALPGKIFTLS